MNDDLIEKAKEVLNGNYQEGGFTIPNKNLYPFQWKWDSGVILNIYGYMSPVFFGFGGML